MVLLKSSPLSVNSFRQAKQGRLQLFKTSTAGTNQFNILRCITFKGISNKIWRTLSGTLVIFLLSCAVCVGQTARIDSLKAVLPTLAADTNRVNTLILLAQELRPRRDSMAVKYANEAYHLAKKLDFLRGKASASTQLGRWKYAKGRLDEALGHYREAMSLHEKAGDIHGMGVANLNMGGVYVAQTKLGEALECYRKAFTQFEQEGDSLEMAKALGGIGLFYDQTGNYSAALDNYFKALKILESANDAEAVIGTLREIANVYNQLGDFTKSIEFYHKVLDIEELDEFGTAATQCNLGIAYSKAGEHKKAMDALNEALAFFKKVNYPYGEAIVLNNIGSAYSRHNDFRAAIQFFRASLQTLGENKNDATLGNLRDLAHAYVKMGLADSALFFGKQGLVVAREVNAPAKVVEIQQALYEACKLKHDYKNAIYYHEQYMAGKDSLFTEESNAKIRELQIKFETEKKDQQIANLDNENALQESRFRNRMLMLGGVTVVTVLVIVILFITIRFNKRRQQTERLLLDEQLRNKKMEAEKLQELDELKSRFFANIAHEFRTPLTLISGPVENMLEDNPDKYLKDQLTLVQNNSSRLLGLVNQLLDLSRLESGAVKLDVQKGDVMAFVKGITFSFQSLADEKEIALACHTSPDSLTMDFDRDKLEKIMSNLLSNAFKFTPDLGTINVTATHTGNNGSSSLEIRVSDSGVGIQDDQLHFIFDRFYQADNAQTRAAQGSGIGLALTKELVQLHGGTIRAESIPGKGTTFSVQLPVFDNANVAEFSDDGQLKKDNRYAHQHEQPANNSVALPNNEKEAIVLVIEDNTEVRQFIVDSLKNDYTIITAGDGEEGIAMATEHVPDLIVSDVMMPVKNGYDTCLALKQDERTSHIPVILLTAKAGLDNKIEGLETGADDYIAKPFSPRELHARVRNLINTRKKLREKYLSQALSGDNAEGKTREDSFLIKIRDAIKLRLDNPELSVDDLCEEVGMSRTSLHRKLKALTGQSAGQFVRILRLQQGQVLLRESDYNVSEIADKVGFTSPAYFAYSYAAHFGYPPSEEQRIVH